MSRIVNCTIAVYSKLEAIFFRGEVFAYFVLPAVGLLILVFFATFYLLEMACLNEEDFLDCHYSLYAVVTLRGSRKGLPNILKRNVRLQRGEFMFRTKGCVAAIKW